MTQEDPLEGKTVIIRSGDNLLSLAIGIGQVFFSLVNPWLAESLRYDWLAGVGVIGICGIIGAWLIYRVDRKDYNSLATLMGLSIVALALLFWNGGANAQGSVQRLPVPLKSVQGEVFLDRNRNGFRDGADKPIQGIGVTLRNQLGQSQNRLSDDDGIVTFSIPADIFNIQFVACGVAQSHRLPATIDVSQPPSSNGLAVPQPYKIDIGIEHDDLENCQP